jgi:hypothetical protein
MLSWQTRQMCEDGVLEYVANELPSSYRFNGWVWEHWRLAFNKQNKDSINHHLSTHHARVSWLNSYSLMCTPCPWHAALLLRLDKKVEPWEIWRMKVVDCVSIRSKQTQATVRCTCLRCLPCDVVVLSPASASSQARSLRINAARMFQQST